MKFGAEYLLSPFTLLPKTGPKISELLSNLANGNKIINLLYHKPSSIIVKNYLPKLYEVKDGEIIVVKVKVESHIVPALKKQPFKVVCYSPSGYLTLIFFKIFPGYIEKNFPIGSEIVVSGKIDHFNGGLQMTHPDYVRPIKLIDQIPGIEIIYPLTYGFNQKFLRSKINEVLSVISDLPEWLDKTLLQKNSWMSWKDSILALHNPKNMPNNLPRRRLAYDELLASQIASKIAKREINYQEGRKTIGDNSLRKKIIANLSFQLTDGQKKVLAEIDEDMATDKKMLRLLQGDVGSGKTILAFLSAISAVENKRQAAIIVPIGLLAEQHFNNLNKLLKGLNIKIAILTGKNTKKQKTEILKNLKSGEIDIIIGTHALIYPEIIFKDLALIVIDEQHRFGVLQRLELIKKGNEPDVLLMSATPIPRSLMMTLYGDMDISILNQKPFNRIDIDTRVLSITRIEEVYKAIKRSMEQGEKIYWICPLIEESEELDFSNVLMRYELFQEKFGAKKVAIIHGKMKDKEKDEIMEKFMSNDDALQLLVATTVIEVGIDVKDATIIIIENCEKFGLSQLHQLRGRVGRGDKKSYCLLLYGNTIGANGKARLTIMKETNDGFHIAEEDLKMRGFGQILGTKQSGLPEYKIANLIYDTDLIITAGRHAEFILNKNPHLQGEQGDAVKTLLKLFNYDDCVRLTHGG